MRLTPRSPLASLGSFAGLALALSACADPLAPSMATGVEPMAAVGSDNSQPVQETFGTGIQTSGNRDLRVDVCPGPVAGDPTVCDAGDFYDAYVLDRNPRWAFPIGTDGSIADGPVQTRWVGPDADADDYYTEPRGDDEYRTTFNLPANALSPTLNIRLYADNLATVYVNGVQIGMQPTGGTTDGDHYPNYGCNYLTPALLCGPDGTPNLNTVSNPYFVAPIGFTSTGEPVVWNYGGTNTLRIVVHNAEFKQGCANVPNSPNCQSATGLDFLAEVRYGIAPPPQVCDFMTFGRLVTEHNGQKVIISGNAGGNKPHGGILGEMNIEIGGTTYHVANIDSYGPITSGILSGSSYPNARIFTGVAKNGAAVEVRMWDGGEPGKGTDMVYVTVAGGPTVGLKLIDQGNLQYHATCRGPK